MKRIRGERGAPPFLLSTIVPYISQATLLTKGKTGVSLCSPLPVHQVYLTETGLSVAESFGLRPSRDLSIPVGNRSTASHLNMKTDMKGHNTDNEKWRTPTDSTLLHQNASPKVSSNRP